VADVHERVAVLDGRVQEHARMLTDVAGAVRHLEARMEQRFTSVDLRFTGLEGRITTLEGRLTALDQKLDQKVDGVATRLDRKIDAVEANLEGKLDSHFRWLVGIQFAMLIALVASFIAG
jgi:hypothetical protein